MAAKNKCRYRVLIYGAGGRQALPVCKGFYEIGCEVTAYCSQKLETGYLTRYVHKRLMYRHDNPWRCGFYEYGERFIKSGRFDLVVPLGDEGAKYLSLHKKRLEQYAKIAVNDYAVFQYAIDKFKTMQICMENGISAPFTVEREQLSAYLESGKLSFPLVIKPKTAVGSIGFNIFHDADALKAYLSSYDGRYGEMLIQEYVRQGNHPQYRADLFIDRCGKVKAAIVGKVTRWYPLDGGSGIYAETIHNKEILQDCIRLLKIIKWNGYANIDLVWDETAGKAKIVEINGRTGASIKLDYVAGVNISQLILENEMGLAVTDLRRYADGKKISCLLPDLLWFLKSPNRFTARPSWFQRFGVRDAVFSLHDPLPAVGFFLTSAASFRDSMKLRRRAK